MLLRKMRQCVMLVYLFCMFQAKDCRSGTLSSPVRCRPLGLIVSVLYCNVVLAKARFQVSLIL
jgi:hypothetical protein